MKFVKIDSLVLAFPTPEAARKFIECVMAADYLERHCYRSSPEKWEYEYVEKKSLELELISEVQWKTERTLDFTELEAAK